MLAAACTSLVGMNATAYDGYSNCYDDCCDCYDFEIYADWLYWSVRRADLDFAVNYDASTTPEEAIGNVYEICPDYDSGFRVGGRVGCDDLYLEGIYTYYDTNSSRRAEGTLAGTRDVPPNAGLLPGAVLAARSTYDVNYQTGDLLVGYELGCDCFEASIFGGFKYAHIDQCLGTRYADTVLFDTLVDKVIQDVMVNAYGIDFGLGASYTLCGCFELFGRASVDILAADVERKYRLESATTGADFVTSVNLDDSCWRMASALNVQLGLGYDFTLDCLCCLQVNLAVGYEFHQWLGLPDFLDYQASIDDDGAAITVTNVTFDRHLQSLGFDGLFVRVGIGF